MGVFSNLVSSFVLGLLTPLTAVCVLPLFPGFLAYLSSQFSQAGTMPEEETRKRFLMFGLVIVFGVILFMFLLGLIFTTILRQSLNQVIGIVSPIAFGILALIGILLIFNFDFSRILPKFNAPVVKSPLFSAFIFGFFFGAIVVPCNPAFIGALFATQLIIVSPVANILNFILFGLGIGAPLLLFSLVSVKWSQSVIGFLTRWKSWINRISGVILLGIAIYYVFFVFRVFG